MTTFAVEQVTSRVSRVLEAYAHCSSWWRNPRTTYQHYKTPFPGKCRVRLYVSNINEYAVVEFRGVEFGCVCLEWKVLSTRRPTIEKKAALEIAIASIGSNDDDSVVQTKTTKLAIHMGSTLSV